MAFDAQTPTAPPTFDAGVYDPPDPPLFNEPAGYLLDAHGWLFDAWGEQARLHNSPPVVQGPAGPFAPMPSYDPTSPPLYGVNTNRLPPHSVRAHRDMEQMPTPVLVTPLDYFPYDDPEAFDDPNEYEKDLP